MVTTYLFFFFNCFLASISCVGLYLAMESENDILWLWRVFISRLPDFLYYPLGGCIKCMSSVFGALFFALYSHLLIGSINWLVLPLSIFVIAYLNMYLYQRLFDEEENEEDI